MKWIFYVIVFVYMFYRAVYGANIVKNSIKVETFDYNGDGYLKVGSRKSISCNPTGKNQKVEWVDPNGVVVKRLPNNRVFVLERLQSPRGGRAPALVLTFTSVQVNDTGEYTCRSGDISETVPLCVMDPSKFMNTVTEVTASRGRSITLSCQAEGNPEPRISWYINDQLITDDNISQKYRVTTKFNSQGFEGLLTIMNLEPEDSGVYYCLAIQQSPHLENCTNIEMANITLQVKHAPTFENDNETTNIYSKIDESVDLVCSAKGYPTPTYTWYKDLGDDSLLEYDETHGKLSEPENQAVLTILAKPSTIGQRFKCVATNIIGEASKSYILLKIERPRKPSEIMCMNSTDTAVQLKISWDDEVVYPIDDVYVQYMKAKSDGHRKVLIPRETDWKNSNKVIAVEDKVNDDSSGMYVSISGLEKETEYWMRVRGSNDVGESPWSDAIKASTLEEKEVEEDGTSIYSTTDNAVYNATESHASDSDISVDNATVYNAVNESLAHPIESGSTFYGLFFTGGIIITAVACMFAIRMV